MAVDQSKHIFCSLNNMLDRIFRGSFYGTHFFYVSYFVKKLLNEDYEIYINTVGQMYKRYLEVISSRTQISEVIDLTIGEI
jgi:hypothetical protein